jgi:hypothetical protein
VPRPGDVVQPAARIEADRSLASGVTLAAFGAPARLPRWRPRSTGGASPPAALLLAQILLLCSVVAPCRRGASPSRCDARLSPRDTSPVAVGRWSVRSSVFRSQARTTWPVCAASSVCACGCWAERVGAGRSDCGDGLRNPTRGGAAKASAAPLSFRQRQRHEVWGTHRPISGAARHPSVASRFLPSPRSSRES